MIASAGLPLAAGLSEAAFGNVLNDLAGRMGWLRAHFRPAQMKSGRYATPMQGDPGFPDDCLVHPLWRVCLVAELKTDTGRLASAQLEWVTAWEAAGVPAFVWRPSHWLPSIVPILVGQVRPVDMRDPASGRVTV